MTTDIHILMFVNGKTFKCTVCVSLHWRDVCSNFLTKFITKYTQRRYRIACVDMCNYLLYNLLIISTYLPHDFIIFYLLIYEFKVKLPKRYIVMKKTQSFVSHFIRSRFVSSSYTSTVYYGNFIIF